MAPKTGLLLRAPLPYVTKPLQQGIESDHFPGEEEHAVNRAPRRMDGGEAANPRPRKRFTNQQMAFALRQAENGATLDEVCL